MKKLNYRFVSQKFGHLRTFGVDLFQKIKSKDFKDFSGKYFETTWDEAIMLPIMEMSCEKVHYIDEYTYLYNMGTGQNDGQIREQLQNKISLFLR